MLVVAVALPTSGRVPGPDSRVPEVWVVAAIDTASLKSAIARMLEGADADAVFISCTSVRIAESVAEIEAELGIPVTSSNHALACHCLRLAGIDDKLPENGRLFAV